jgi:hypothetical protein
MASDEMMGFAVLNPSYASCAFPRTSPFQETSLRGAQATKQSILTLRPHGLLRFARNDVGSAIAHRISTRFTCQTARRAPAQLRDLAACSARVLLETSRPLPSEGAGNTGRPKHPQPRVRNKKAHELVTTVTPESPGIPRAMVLTAYNVLSPVTGLFCHRRLRFLSQT